MTAASNDPSQRFQEAAGFLSSAPSLSKVSNTTKLELYGLFKYVTASREPNTSRPSIFDMTGRAKWDAWASVGKTYATASDAENRYLELARELGWKEGSGSKVSTTEDGMNKTSKTKEGEESIWDDDDPDAPVKKRSGGGMGNKVSTLVVEDEAERQEGNLHSVVLSGDQKQLEDFLQSHPEIDLDQVDEFGYTPLHLAADRGHIEVVRLLLGRGANRAIKDEDEFTALDLAQIASHEDIVTLLKL